jgi:hypothetical protein
MKNYYPYEKFSKAIHYMVASPEPIQKRIANAYVSELHLVRPEELPEAIRYRFTQITEKLTSIEPVGDEGSVYATTAKMDTRTAGDIADELFSIYQTLIAEHYGS